MVKTNSNINTIEDLWGDLDLLQEEKSPRTILEEQANLLSQKTNGLLEAEIYTFSHPIGGSARYTIHHVFYVKAKKIDYQMQLFKVVRFLNEYYPIEITWGSEIIQKIQTEEDFLKQIKYVLRHKTTKIRLQKLIAKVA